MADTIKKPAKAVFRRMFAGEATAEEKAHIQAYLRSKRAPAISRDERNRARYVYDRFTRLAKRQGKVAVAALHVTTVFPGVWTVREHTEDEEYLVAAYEKTGRALVSYRSAGEEGMYLKPRGGTALRYKNAWHSSPGAAFQAIANQIDLTVVWDGRKFAPGAIPGVEPEFVQRMTRKKFIQTYKDEINAAMAPGVNLFLAAKVAHAAFEAAPESHKVAAIGASIRQAQKYGTLKPR